MICIYLGNVGSGKTVSAVREMYKNDHIKTYSNIITKLKNQKNLDYSMLIEKQITGEKRKKDGSIEEIYKLTINKKFWYDVKKPINVIIDEAHTILNSRRSFTKVNVLITEWLSLIRKILGDKEETGSLIFITQLPNRLDVIARDMATLVKYHICYFTKICSKCGSIYNENSETPSKISHCLKCGHYKLTKHNHKIMVYEFANMEDMDLWKKTGSKSYFNHYFINDIEKYFHLYDTLQWDNMFSELYI